MTPNSSVSNIRNDSHTVLINEILWVQKMMQVNLDAYFNPNENSYKQIETYAPDISEDSFYNIFLEKNVIGIKGRFILAIAIATILKPDTFELLMTNNPNSNSGYPAFGGNIEGNRFIPTYRTACILSGDRHTLDFITLFNSSNLFKNSDIFDCSDISVRDFLDTPIKLSKACSYFLFTHKPYEFELSGAFPAEKLETNLTWKDFICSDEVKHQLQEILNWFEQRSFLNTDSHYKKWIKPGYRALFYGPSGTGKTLITNLLGKKVNQPVYRIDLSMIVSKYIGETIKNLAKVFNQAEKNDWILFFDEADSLFGKRTQTESANDRHANQEVGFLLQRIEAYDGLIILASNLKNNIDDAFSRRFQSIIHFRKPNAQQRLNLWQNIFIPELGLSDTFLRDMAKKHELTGGNLINILRTSKLFSSSQFLTEEAVVFAIKKEINKQ